MKQAVILVGGKGTRLKDLTKSFPKPLIEINGRPFICYILDRLRHFGISNIILLAGHGGDHIKNYFLSGYKDLTIHINIEKELKGTAGALNDVRDKLHSKFLLLNGDSIFDCNWSSLFLYNDSTTAISMALREVADSARYGSVELDKSTKRVIGFQEKTHTSTQSFNIINGGVYGVNRDALMPFLGDHSSLEEDIFPLLAAKELIKGSLQEGFFIDIGVPESLEKARTLFPDALDRPILLFDRDSTLTIDKGYTHKVVDLNWIKGAKECIKLLNDTGFLVFVVTNQSGIARGYFTEDEMHAFHEAMQEDLHAIDAHINGFYYCPHHPEGNIPTLSIECICRKPNTGMLQKIEREMSLSLNRAILIGDNKKDIECAQNYNIISHQFTGGSLLDFLYQHNVLN